MRINPLLIEAVKIVSDSTVHVTLKHVSETTDMSKQLKETLTEMAKPFQKGGSKNIKVDVTDHGDGRIYVYFSSDIYHPDNFWENEKRKTAFMNKVKENRLLII